MRRGKLSQLGCQETAPPLIGKRIDPGLGVPVEIEHASVFFDLFYNRGKKGVGISPYWIFKKMPIHDGGRNLQELESPGLEGIKGIIGKRGAAAETNRVAPGHRTIVVKAGVDQTTERLLWIAPVDMPVMATVARDRRAEKIFEVALLAAQK